MTVRNTPGLAFFVSAFVAWMTLLCRGLADSPPPRMEHPDDFAEKVRPVLALYCVSCHSTKLEKGGVDLEQFRTSADIRRRFAVWESVVQQIETGEMPPKGKPRPTEAEAKTVIAWVRDFLRQEAEARRGDPGPAPLRRLSHAEYDRTIRDLTGVDLRPAREFPPDGAAGEGFTNAAEALTDISPELFAKYFAAAKQIAEHAVLLPDGFRFSPSKTRRDWTDEGTARLRAFYSPWAGNDGRLDFVPYLKATIVHRDALRQGRLREVAQKEKLNPKYLSVLWQFWNQPNPEGFLAGWCRRWREARAEDVPALAASIEAARAAMWRTVKIGNYVQASWNSPGGYVESLSRQVPADPTPQPRVTLRLPIQPAADQSDVTIYLGAVEEEGEGPVIWSRPRFEGAGKPTLLLSDYPTYGPAFELRYPTLFARTAEYLAAVREAALKSDSTLEDIARQRNLDAEWLKRWHETLALVPPAKPPAEGEFADSIPATPLILLDEKVRLDSSRPHLVGWRKRGEELPSLVANSADWAETIPGRIPAHGIGVHPTPREFVGVAWRSPLRGSVRIAGRVEHAHPACGNGVAWELEHRRQDRARIIARADIALGTAGAIAPVECRVEPGDQLLLRVEAKDGNHYCDMTAIDWTISEDDGAKRSWNLLRDVADSVLAGNPHADGYGQAGVWSFVRGPSRQSSRGKDGVIPAESVLGRWLDAAAADPAKPPQVEQLALAVQTLLSGPIPSDEKSPDRLLYDALVGPESPLFQGLDPTRWGQRRDDSLGLPRERFGEPDAASLATSTKVVTRIRLPASLFRGREFVVEAALPAGGDRLVRVFVGTEPPTADASWNMPLLAKADGAAYRRFRTAADEVRRVFPLYLCFPQVVPTDEVVTLKMFHREDEPLIRLFLDDDQVRRLDRLWVEQRFISRQPVAEYEYLPQFIGYTTQDTPKEFQQFFIQRTPLFRQQAEEFLAEEERAVPGQIAALIDWAAQAYRRPLTADEQAELRRLYHALREKGTSHEEAFRGVLSRILISPAFLYRFEQSPPGRDPRPLNDWELASRLSYFLWSSVPDEPLRAAAVAGRLNDPAELLAQTQRMLRDPKARALAIEFGTQWIHVRGFDEFNEKNEQLFPSFNPELRQALYEEAILFFLDFFQANRRITELLDADHTFLNETLAKHYGIPDVIGPDWRRVDGVRRYGRGGILTLGSVLSKQAGASRTSPVLRGNWIVETLLGEKLPKPPPNVPQLPDAEGSERLTMRQLVERHAADPACATCHVRIDPFGFTLERYDPIGRWRERDLGGLPIDTKTKLRDGTELDGVEGLRAYLLGPKQDVFVRLFCRRLLGYALGRSVSLGDMPLLDEMVSAVKRHDGRIHAAIEVMVMSPQFRMIRGRDFAEE